MSAKHKKEKNVADAIMFGRIVRMNETNYLDCPILVLFVVLNTDHTDKHLIKSLGHTISHQDGVSGVRLLHSNHLAELSGDTTGGIHALVTIKINNI